MDIEEDQLKYIVGYTLLILILIIYITNRIKLKKNLPSLQNKDIPYKVSNLAKTSYIPERRKKCIKLIRENNYDVNYPTCEDKFNLFLCACFGGDRNLIEFMLTRGANINTTNSYGDSPLYLFIYAYLTYGNDLDAFDILIKAGCDINFPNEYCYTPLHLAAAKGNFKVTSKLLKYGALPSIKNKAGILPIQSDLNY
ncbi:ankyrin repeat domain-containing protein 23-like [Centruroides vittatus]|uniref:ankyrin repeat domain-containing protein 23-like n=1 Tax=Centruroides vittatus TaxID=120091 RepID=UPI00350FB7A5